MSWPSALVAMSAILTTGVLIGSGKLMEFFDWWRDRDRAEKE